MDRKAMSKETQKGRKDFYGLEYLREDLRTSGIRSQLVNDKDYDVMRLWSQSHEILNLHTLGYKHTEVAKMLGITPKTVEKTVNSTLGKRKISELRRDRDKEYDVMRDKVMDLTKKSLEIYEQILNEDEERGVISLKDKKKTADTIVLELSGLRAPVKHENRSVSMKLSIDDIDSFKRRGIEAARSSGKLIEINNNDDQFLEEEECDE